GYVGVAGVEIYFSGSACCKQGKPGSERHDPLFFDGEHIGSQATIMLHSFTSDLCFRDQIDGDMVFIDCDIRVVTGCCDKRPFDFATGHIVGMKNSSLAMPSL